MIKPEQVQCDYLIIGAGLIGSSTAMHLAEFLRSQGARIIVADADLEGKLSSSELNAGGARATWDQQVNVSLARDSIAFMQEHAVEVGFHAVGYLWMFSPENWDAARRRAAELSRQGLNVIPLTVAELQSRAPFIDKLDHLAGATFSPQDGLFNPNLLKNIFRQRARKQGVEFWDGHRVLSVSHESNGDLTVACQVATPEERELKNFLVDPDAPAPAANKKIRTKYIVNCAGAWSGHLAKLIGYESPVWAVRRQVSIFSCRDLDMRKNGMVVDTSGVYFHPEADNILAGWADPDEPRGFNLEYDGAKFFEEKIWMPLYGRSSKFESLKHITGWGGLYEMTPDCSGIIGQAPGQARVFENQGFSGRGAMQSYAAGRGLAELIAFKKFQTLDLRSLSGERFREHKFVPEGLHI